MIMNTILDFKPEAVVIDAGMFPHHAIALRWLEGCERIVCCDGAANDYIHRGGKVWRIVGDCDSLAPEVMARYAAIVRRNPDQETNDQTKAVEYLRGKGVRRVAILGATGKREDHTLGNISLLVDYLRAGVEARAYTDYGVFIPVSGSWTFSCPRGTKVSIFNFGAREMRAEGLRYPLRDFDRLWQGTLNVTVASDFTINAKGEYLVFINFD